MIVMELENSIEIINLGLWLKKSKIVVIADTHIGYEESLNKRGLLVPRFQLNDIINNLESIFKKTDKIDKLIITGDFKHEFGRITEQEWDDSRKFVEFAKNYCNEIIIVKGNHDVNLKPLASKRGIILADYFYAEKENAYICHGDLIPKTKEYKKAKVVIIGHQHPAIALREGVRTERYKCFLKGRYDNKTIIVLPSFMEITPGSDITAGEIISPLIKDIEDFSVYIIGDKIYDFGKVKNVLRLK